MKKRPGKKTCKTCQGTGHIIDIFGEDVRCSHCHLIYQWNACHDAHTEWLPSKQELIEIINENTPFFSLSDNKVDILAEAIRKRLT